MFKKGDRVKEGNQIGVVTAIHTPGTVDVLFDGEEYAIRRQDYDVTLLKGNPMERTWKKQGENLWTSKDSQGRYMIQRIRSRYHAFEWIPNMSDWWACGKPQRTLTKAKTACFTQQPIQAKGNPMRIIRNKAHLRLVKPKKKSKRVKKLTQSMRDKLPKSDFIFPKRRSFPIPDIGHGRLALQYGQFPNNRKDLEKIKKAVFKRYPSLIKWWNSHHPEDRWTQRRQKRKMVANPMFTNNPSKNRWKMKKSKQNGRIVYIVTGRVRRGPKVFYTLKNAQDFMDRRKRD